jgi:hypothetical protein
VRLLTDSLVTGAAVVSSDNAPTTTVPMGELDWPKDSRQ